MVRSHQLLRVIPKTKCDSVTASAEKTFAITKTINLVQPTKDNANTQSAASTWHHHHWQQSDKCLGKDLTLPNTHKLAHTKNGLSLKHSQITFLPNILDETTHGRAIGRTAFCNYCGWHERKSYTLMGKGICDDSFLEYDGIALWSYL